MQVGRAAGLGGHSCLYGTTGGFCLHNIGDGPWAASADAYVERAASGCFMALLFAFLPDVLPPRGCAKGFDLGSFCNIFIQRGNVSAMRGLAE